MEVLIEYVIVFIGVFVLNIFMMNFSEEMIKPQLIYLKKIYRISIRKEDMKSFTWVVIWLNTFIIDTTYIIVIYLLRGIILRIIIGVILLILLIIISYGLLGKYYIKKESDNYV